MSELRYVWCSDYLIPDLTLNAKVYPPLGKYGRMGERYLRENEPEHMPEAEQMIRNHEEIEDILGEILRILVKLS